MESITQRLDRPTNMWSKALYYIILDFTAGTNMKKVLNHSPLFWKFQTRVSDIAKWHKEFDNNLQRIPIAFEDKATGKTGYYMHYTYTGNRAYLVNLYNKIQKMGLYRSHKPKNNPPR